MTQEETVEPRLDNSLERYTKGLKRLEAESLPSKEQILEVLLARDALKSVLTEPGVLGSAVWDRVNKLDEQLKALAAKVYQVSDLPHWRTLVKDKDKEFEDWWWFLPQQGKLDDSLKRYETEFRHLEAESPPSKEQILKVLLARDALKSALTEPGVLGSTVWDRVNKLDEQLKALAAKVYYQVSDLPHWRTLVKDKDKEEDWWWFLSVTRPEGKQDWLLSALSLTFLTISLGLVSNLGPRFWSNGPDVFSSVSIAGQTVLSLLVAGGVLTNAGREGIERAMTRWKLPKQDRQRYLCGISFALMVAPIGVYLLLPKIADYYTQQGKRDYQAGQWVSAKRNLERAILVHPDQAEAHLEMGKLHEDTQELDKAKSEYRIAMQAGNAEAFNNLARLSILGKENKVDAVISLLNQAEAMARAQNNKEVTKEFNYALQRNKGWVRLDQKRYLEAKEALLQAQTLMPEQASAHCLLAQVLNKQNEPSKPTQEEKIKAIYSGQTLKEASNELQEGEKKAWQACQKYARPTVPEEDVWIDQAKKCLNPKTRNGCLEKSSEKISVGGSD